jgi:haloacetate dehalogenase
MFEGFREERIAVGGATVHLKIGGKGAPLLLLHGYPQTHLMWHRIAAELARRYTVVCPDLRGYGASSKPPEGADHAGYAKRAMALDQVEIMAKLGFDRFQVVGHDRGGRVTHRLCLDQPQKVERACVIDIAPTLTMYEATDKAFATAYYHWFFLIQPAPLPERLIGADPDFFVRHLLERWAGDATRLDPAAVAQYIAQFRNPATLAATCEDYRAGAGCDWDDDRTDRDAGRRIGCPVLILWGRGYIGHPSPSSGTTPRAIWRRWADDVSEVALDCGHFIVEEEPEKAAAALLGFFTR